MTKKQKRVLIDLDVAAEIDKEREQEIPHEARLSQEQQDLLTTLAEALVDSMLAASEEKRRADS
jgi:hypothetical protein